MMLPMHSPMGYVAQLMKNAHMQVYWTMLIEYFAHGACQLDACCSGEAPTAPYHLLQRAVATPHLPLDAFGGDGTDHPHQKGCPRHHAIPGTHSEGLHHARQHPDLWQIKDATAQSVGRHTVQLCDTCSHFLKNNGHPPLVPVDGFGTTCPLGRKYQLPTTEAKIQELVDIVGLPDIAGQPDIVCQPDILGLPARRKALAHELVDKLQAQMKRGSIVCCSVSAEPGINTAAICSDWRELAASLHASDSVPDHKEMRAFQKLFHLITTDLISHFNAHPPPRNDSLTSMWDYRTARGIAVYSRYETRWQDALLDAAGFTSRRTTGVPLMDVFMRFLHAIVSCCQSGGRPIPTLGFIHAAA